MLLHGKLAINCRRSASVAAKATAGATAPSSYTRVLRYPNGNERRIRYPVVSTPLAEDAALVPAFETRSKSDVGLRPGQEEQQTEEWLYDESDDSSNPLNWDECDLWGASCNPAFTQDKSLEELSAAEAPMTFEQELAAHSAGVAEMVRSSYQVLRGSPWLLSKPLHVLATPSRTMHSLQVRFEKAGALDELATILKQSDLASKLTVNEMKDGVVAFETAEDAARYATFLEVDIDDEVDVLLVDSNRLFLNAGDVDAVVVYLPGGRSFLPMPYQLANSLRAENASLIA